MWDFKKTPLEHAVMGGYVFLTVKEKEICAGSIVTAFGLWLDGIEESYANLSGLADQPACARFL